MATITIDEVQRLATQLSAAEQLQLVERLAHELRKRQQAFAPDDFPAAVSAEAASKVLGIEDFSDWESKSTSR